ncbi:MAG: hypothetical protein DRJ30_04715 [Candidatus Methanomethylicota archaeon]|nr:MAG: hypothetical protein DRJ30_04715 [Candidatus Verstraetearchaeota archaeon]
MRESKIKVIKVRGIREVAEKIKGRSYNTIIIVEEPSRRPPLKKDESEIIREYFKAIMENGEFKVKIETAINRVKKRKDAMMLVKGIEKILNTIAVLTVENSKINVTAIILKGENVQKIINTLIFLQILQEDLSLSTGLDIGQICTFIPIIR